MSTPTYKLIFVAHHGPGPWPCMMCGLPIQLMEPRWAVHHYDHDRRNDDPANLAAVHPACHQRHHMSHRDPEQLREQGRRLHHPEIRAKANAAKRGRPGYPLSDEAKAKIGAAHRGRRHSAESRANMSAAHKGSGWSEMRRRLHAAKTFTEVEFPLPPQSSRPAQCMAEGCVATVLARGLCSNHYAVARRTARRRGAM